MMQNVRRPPFVLSLIAEPRAKSWYQENVFKPPVAWADVCSKAVVLLLLICCLLLLPLWESVIVQCLLIRTVCPF